MTAIRGMTWSHPRGYDPMLATARVWAEKTGVAVAWDKRSLQDFESFPVEELARQYDLIVLDHPHLGQVVAENCLAPLDVAGYDAALAELERHSVGQSFQSYRVQGRQWALPIDAATQVQAIRPDRLAEAPKRWAEVMALAREGRVVLPLRSPHSLMVFMTLAANLGTPCASGPDGALIDRETGERVWEIMRALFARLDPACLEMDPIAASEAMARPDSPLHCMPLGYGYVSYARSGFRGARLLFCDIPAVGDHGPLGTVLGGTGIAVSARSQQKEEAIAHAFWLASAEVQRGVYAQSGGQPGHGLAWEDDTVNEAAGGFYRNTRATLEGAWVRPRHNGYMAFQAAAADLINRALVEHWASGPLLDQLNTLFARSRPG